MGYVIACDSRNRDEMLFMVDRRRQRASFWSNRLDDVFEYADRGAALTKANSLKFNNARVMTRRDAESYMDRVEQERVWDAASMDNEAGWDGHKTAF